MDSMMLVKLFCSAPLTLKFAGCGCLFSHQQSLVLHRLLVVFGAMDLQKSPFLLAAWLHLTLDSFCTYVSLKLPQTEGQRLYQGELTAGLEHDQPLMGPR